jgi:putative oxidoreductase
MSNSSNRSWGITVLRVAVGIVFLMHGIQKLFSIGVPGVEGFLGSLGIPFPRFFGVVVTLVELFGGAALLFGVATRLTALLLAIDMTVAILKVHLKNGFFVPNGVEFTLTLLAANLCLLVVGAGAASIDGALWGEKRERSPDPVKRQV